MGYYHIRLPASVLLYDKQRIISSTTFHNCYYTSFLYCTSYIFLRRMFLRFTEKQLLSCKCWNYSTYKRTFMVRKLRSGQGRHHSKAREKLIFVVTVNDFRELLQSWEKNQNNNQNVLPLAMAVVILDTLKNTSPKDGFWISS